MKYWALQKSNPVILWLWKENSASDPHAANKVVVNSSYGKLYNKNDPLKVKFVRTIDKG